MKKLFAIISLAFVFLVGFNPPEAKAQTVTVITAAQSQGDFNNWLSTLDTLTNTDTTTYIVTVKGPKHCITISTDVLKISGTVASAIKVYGSINGGVSYISTALSNVTITDTSFNYGISYALNGYDTYKIQMITAGTQRFSQRTRMMWRHTP